MNHRAADDVAQRSAAALHPQVKPLDGQEVSRLGQDHIHACILGSPNFQVKAESSNTPGASKQERLPEEALWL